MTNPEKLPQDFSYLDFVATDPNLVAFYEIKTLGFVATVERISPAREDALEDYDREQLLHEMMRDYSIDRPDVMLAESACLSAIYNRNREESHGF